MKDKLVYLCIGIALTVLFFVFREEVYNMFYYASGFNDQLWNLGLYDIIAIITIPFFLCKQRRQPSPPSVLLHPLVVSVFDVAIIEFVVVVDVVSIAITALDVICSTDLPPSTLITTCWS